MRNMMRLLVVALALLISIPAMFAQTPETSTLPVDQPLDVGGTILQPGVYTIRVLPRFTDRNQIQITSPDMKTVFATVLTIPHQLEPAEEIPNTTFVYYPAGEGEPQALRTWFAPHPDASGAGHDIVYKESRAKQLARLAHSRVVSYRDESAVADLNTVPLVVVTPEATVETYTYTAPPAPMISAAPEKPVQVAETTPTEMPRTASNIPLVALLGLLSVGAAVAFRIARPE